MLFLLGLLVGFLAGFAMAWIFSLWPSTPDIFHRIFRSEFMSSRNRVQVRLVEVEQRVAKQEGLVLSFQERISRMEGLLKNGGEVARLSVAGRPAKSRISNPLHQKVFDLHQQGKDITEIARELDMGKGEVELTLAWIRNSGNSKRVKEG